MNQPADKATTKPLLDLDSTGWRSFDYIYQQLRQTCQDLGLAALYEGRAADQALSLDELTKHSGLPPHSMRLLAMACVAFGLLRKDDQGGYVPTGALAWKMSPLPDDFGWIRQVYLPSWAHLTRSLREGTNAGLQVLPGSGATLYERMSHHPEVEKVFTAARGQTMINRRLPLLLGALGTLPEFAHVLDVGGGDGTAARSISNQFGKARVTVLELPSVAEHGRKLAANQGASVDFVSGDAFAGAWPSGVDVVVFSAFLEIFSPQRIQAALRQAHACLPAGGHLLINQTYCDDDETGPMWPSVLSLYFLNLASGEGMCYPASDFERWCREAGFAEVRQFVQNPGDDARVLIARK